MTTSPLKVEDSRADFEKWCAEITGYTSQFLRQYRKEEGYAEDFPYFVYWLTWQASRAAIALDIDWPEANDDTWKEGVEGAYAMGHEDGKDKVVIAVRQGLRAAGITVKGDS